MCPRGRKRDSSLPHLRGQFTDALRQARAVRNDDEPDHARQVSAAVLISSHAEVAPGS